MSARFLLDTNILSDLVRQPQGRVAAKISDVGEAAVATSIIVAAELRYGVARKGSKRLAVQVQAVLGAIEIMPLEVPVDRVYGQVRAELGGFRHANWRKRSLDRRARPRDGYGPCDGKPG